MPTASSMLLSTESMRTLSRGKVEVTFRWGSGSRQSRPQKISVTRQRIRLFRVDFFISVSSKQGAVSKHGACLDEALVYS